MALVFFRRPPGPELRGVLRVRARRSFGNRSQRFDPPLGSGRMARGHSRGGGPVGGAGTGRAPEARRGAGGAGPGGCREAGRRGAPGTRARGRAAGRHSRARGGGAARQSPRRAHTGRVAGAAAGRGENGPPGAGGADGARAGPNFAGWAAARARGNGPPGAGPGRARRAVPGTRGAGRRRKAASKLPACVGFPPAGKSAGRAGAVFAYKEARFPARLICLISAVSARKPCAFHRLAFCAPPSD